MPNVKNKLYSIFADKHKRKGKGCYSEGTRMLAGYIKSIFVYNYTYRLWKY